MVGVLQGEAAMGPRSYGGSPEQPKITARAACPDAPVGPRSDTGRGWVSLPCEVRQLEQAGGADEVMDGRDRGERGGRAGAGRLRNLARVERLEEPPHALRLGGALRVFDEDERWRHAGAPQRHRDRAGAELVGQGNHGGQESSGGAVVMTRRRDTMRA